MSQNTAMPATGWSFSHSRSERHTSNGPPATAPATCAIESRENGCTGARLCATSPLVGMGVPNWIVHQIHQGASTTAPATAPGTTSRRGPRQSCSAPSSATSSSVSIRANTASPATIPTTTARPVVGRTFAHIHSATSATEHRIANDVSSPPSAIDTATGEIAHSAAAATAATRPAKRYATHASTTMVAVSTTTRSARSRRSAVSGLSVIQNTGTSRKPSRAWNPLVSVCPSTVGPCPLASERAMVSV